jgi:exosome complex component RRP41
MKRLDGRQAGETRPIEITAGVLENATGSAMVRMGKTVAVAGVFGPREKLQEFKKASLMCRYMMMPFSTDERVRPGLSRRSKEISMVVRNALEPAIFTEEFPKAAIDIFIDILQADAGTRTAAINAASVALADAGVPMRDLVCSVAAGKIGKDYVIDLAGKEEDESACDLPVAYMPRQGNFSLLQMDGDLPKEDVKRLLKLVTKACEEIYEKQKKALEKRWIK